MFELDYNQCRGEKMVTNGKKTLRKRYGIIAIYSRDIIRLVRTADYARPRESIIIIVTFYNRWNRFDVAIITASKSGVLNHISQVEHLTHS